MCPKAFCTGACICIALCVAFLAHVHVHIAEIAMDQILHRFPSVSNAEIRQMINGPESFTHDMSPAIGEVPEVGPDLEFLYVAMHCVYMHYVHICVCVCVCVCIYVCVCGCVWMCAYVEYRLRTTMWQPALTPEES